jgi:hypothetical protein
MVRMYVMAITAQQVKIIKGAFEDYLINMTTWTKEIMPIMCHVDKGRNTMKG